MKSEEYAALVIKNIKMMELFFEAYVIAQLVECCENCSDRWGISAEEHKEFVAEYCGWYINPYSDASDYYDESLSLVGIALEGTDYEEAENPYEEGTVWSILAGHCWGILNKHNWFMDYYEAE